ncbi:dUTP diphosphatase [Lysinibacillus sp. FW12]|uniref:dUTP diphosphatase n=1 Tax=Lysinibacillus sp. FW12 TaxID=3096079 RepID=UPI003D70EA1F
MNLTKLFETQASLDERIIQEHPELRGQNNLDWKLLALQVELGECANEWRGFKKWSKNQKPLTRILTTEGATNQNAVEYKCGDDECSFTFDAKDGRLKDLWGDISDDCPICENGQLYAMRLKNPLLEEYVDCLHFILSIGLEIECTPGICGEALTVPNSDITNQFLRLMEEAFKIQHNLRFKDMHKDKSALALNTAFSNYLRMLGIFRGLGEMLGFTWEQVEEAYYARIRSITLDKKTDIK